MRRAGWAVKLANLREESNARIKRLDGPPSLLPVAVQRRIVRIFLNLSASAFSRMKLHVPKSSPQTIVVVPCYNEARRFDIRAFDQFLAECDEVQLLFVDDGSTDDTPLMLERLRQMHPRKVSTQRLSTNRGKAEAVRRGIQVAMRRRPAFVGYWDADIATPLQTIPQFIEVLHAQSRVQLVMGCRVAMLGRQIVRNSWRHFLGRTFATAASIVLKLSVYDTQCGAKLFRFTPEVAEVFSQPFTSRWVFDVEILARIDAIASATQLAYSAHQLVYEYPLEEWHDVQGSHLRALDFVLAFKDLCSIYLRYMRRRERAQPPMTRRIEDAPGYEQEKRSAA
jgi:dolichyl-phosphate beta-glucosyltransferase